LHVAQISFFSDPQEREPAQLLRDWPTVVNVAEAAVCAGVRVSVVQACSHSQRLPGNGVSYHFLPFGDTAEKRGRISGLGKLLRELAPEVLHVQGLEFSADVLALAALAPQIPILLQDHASGPPRFWRRPLWRRALSAASGLAFCALEQAQPFMRAGLVAPGTRLYEIPESTSRFTPGDPWHARRTLGVYGDPLVLWIGHLDANKDPLTVLDGISAAARALPQLQLWCCFGKAPLMDEVRGRIDADPLLRERVHLLGPASHERVEQLMQAADVFVLGSHREGSGYALIEALACGLPPVVTDIASFRTLTGDGRVGALWPCGDAGKLRDRLLTVAAQPQAPLRAAARAHFDKELSFAAVGRKLAACYQDLLQRRDWLRPSGYQPRLAQS
jgi:glycosyltransferase involved in cell wall biosynthesis